jgi:chemotaxis protein methyltransferase CheR
MWTASSGEPPLKPAPPGADTFRPLTAREFEKIRQLAYRTFGLDLKPGKQALVSARLGKQMRSSRFRTFEEYVSHVEQDSTGEALAAMVDALTTNFTSFFRESAHFDFLSGTVWAELRNHDRLSIWSAACATGEEPYSIAISLLEASNSVFAAKFRVLATDISTRALAVARAGVYTKDKLEPVGRLLPKYFSKRQGECDAFQLRPEVRGLVEFAHANLVEGRLPAGPFQVVFCRNVMIYFDKPTQERVVNRLAASIEPGGYLFVGHAESLTGIDHPLTYVQPAVYRKDAAGAPRRAASSRTGR